MQGDAEGKSVSEASNGDKEATNAEDNDEDDEDGDDHIRSESDSEDEDAIHDDASEDFNGESEDEDLEERESIEVVGGEDLTESEKQIEYANMIIRMTQRRLRRDDPASMLVVGAVKSKTAADNEIMRSMMEARQRRMAEAESNLLFDNPWD